jgi:hypothetical protein
MTDVRALVAKRAVWGRRNGAYIRQPKIREEVILHGYCLYARAGVYE